MTASAMVIQPKYLSGSVQAIPSKSDAHRRLICASLADGETAIAIGPDPLGDDIQSTIHCLRALGARIVRADDRRIVVHPVSCSTKRTHSKAAEAMSRGSKKSIRQAIRFCSTMQKR